MKWQWHAVNGMDVIWNKNIFFFQGGVQSLEAMLFTIDYINNHGIIPAVKIGAYILDDWDKDTYGLEQAVDFIKGKCVIMLKLHFASIYSWADHKYM